MIIGCQQNKLNPQWDYLIKFLSLDLANWSIYVETGESCCLKWSFSLTLSEIPWRFSSILPNVKISLTLCKIPWQFPALEKFYFSLTFPWRLWTLFSISGYNSFRPNLPRPFAKHSVTDRSYCESVTNWQTVNIFVDMGLVYMSDN